MKVKIIQEVYVYQLEDSINNWIRVNPHYKVIDIKYCTVPGYSTSDYSAMIIYE